MPAKESLALVSFQKRVKGGQCKSADKYVHHSYIGWSTVTYWIFHFFLYSFIIREKMPVRRITPAWAKQLQKKKGGGGRERVDKMKNTATPHEGMFMLYFFFLLDLARTGIIQMQVSSHKLLANGILMLLWWWLHENTGLVKSSVANVQSLPMSSVTVAFKLTFAQN